MATFGNTITGTGTATVGEDEACCFQASISIDMQINSIHALNDIPIGTTPIKAVTWDGNNSYNVATNGVGGTATVTTTKAWRTMTYSTKPVCLRGLSYRWGYVVDATAIAQYFEDTNSYTGYIDETNNYDTPQIFNSTSPTDKYCIYIDYTEVGPGAPITTKLYYYKGASYGINLYSATTGMTNYMQVYAESGTRYAALDSNLSNSMATDMRVRKGGTTYAVLSQWSPT